MSYDPTEQEIIDAFLGIFSMSEWTPDMDLIAFLNPNPLIAAGQNCPNHCCINIGRI